MHRGIESNREAWLKQDTDMNREPKKKKNAKNDLEKKFFKLTFFWTMRFLEKQRDVKFVTTEARRNYLVSEPNLLVTYTENVLVIKMKNV